MTSSRRPWSPIEKWMVATTLVVFVALLANAFWRMKQRDVQLPLQSVSQSQWEMPKDSWNYTSSISPHGDVAAVAYLRGGWGVSIPPAKGGWAREYAADLRDGVTGTFLRPLQAPTPSVTWLTRPVFSPDSAYVAMVYSNNEMQKVDKTDVVAGKHVAVWDVATGLLVWTSRYADAKENASALSLQWTPDGKFLIVDGDFLRVMDAATGKRLRTLAQAFYQYTDASLSPDGKRLVTINEGHRVPKGPFLGPRLAIIRDLRGRVLVRLPGRGTIQAFWTRDGKTLIQALKNQVCAWSGDGRRMLWKLPVKETFSRSFTLSPDGAKLAWVSSQQRAGCKGNPDTCADFSTVQVFDVTTRRLLWRQKVEGFIDYARFVTKGTRLFTVAGTNDRDTTHPPHLPNTFQLWNAATGKTLQSTQMGGQSPSALFHPDNKRALLQTTQMLKTWSLESLK